MNIRYLIFVMGLVILSAFPGRGAIVDIGVRDWFWRPVPAQFDAENQILTIMDERRTVPENPYQDSGMFTRIDGYYTLPSQQGETLRIVWNISNASPAAWTGFLMNFGGDINTGASIIDGSLQCDVFSEVVRYLADLEFSGSGVVLPGETLTIQFDAGVRASHPAGLFGIGMWGAPIPEPTSFLVLACGAVMLLRKRRCVQCVE